MTHRNWQKGVWVWSVCLLLLGFAIATNTSAAPQQPAAATGGGVLLNDGSFENEPSAWTETDNTDCTPWIGDWTSVGGPAAFHGTQYFWAGGACGPDGNQEANSNRVSQTITFEPIDETLTFWYQIARNGADTDPNDDYANVLINDQIVWRRALTQANVTTTWMQATVDITAFAGQTVNLEFTVKNGIKPGYGSVYYDYVQVLQGQVRDPEITIEKSTTTPTILAGQTAVFDINVTNSGNVALLDVAVTDPMAPATCARVLGKLGVAESESYTCEVTGQTSTFTNTAQVTAVDSVGVKVNDSDSATVTVVNPNISIDVQPDAQDVAAGGTANFDIVVKNEGDTPLFNVEVNAPNAPNCNRSFSRINVGNDEAYSCSRTNVQQSFLNTVNVMADGPSNQKIQASDSSFVNIDQANLRVVIEPGIQAVVKGQIADFTIVVQNEETNLLLQDVTVSSDKVPGCNKTLGDLQANEIKIVRCSLESVQESFINFVEVSAVIQGGAVVSEAELAIVDVLDLGVQATAVPGSLTAPGGVVKINVTLTNKGTRSLTTESVSATLNSIALNNISNDSCQAGVSIPVNGTYHCSFDVSIQGSAGSYKINVTGSASNASQNVSAQGTANVTLNAPPITDLYLPLLLNSYVVSEPNDKCGEAFPIVPNVTYEFLPDDQYDWYSFELDAATTLQVVLTEFKPIQGQVLVYAGTCNAPTFLGSNGDFSTTKIVNLGNRGVGKYLVWVINDAAPNDTDLYKLRISAP